LAIFDSPVLCVIPYDDEDEAITIANDSNYGLQAYVESADVAHAHRVAEQLNCGRVVINGAPHAPWPPSGDSSSPSSSGGPGDPRLKPRR
jgi:aldehyde dehydrogenase (NAD+)